MGYDNLGQSLKERVASWRLGRKLVWFLVIVTLLTILFSVFAVSCNFSDGVRGGVVRKFSKKGLLIKTWEGELQLSALSGADSDPANVAVGGSVWEFSVSGGNQEVIDALYQAAASGKRVALRYHQKYYRLKIFGDTKYFVYKVEEVK